MLLPDRGWVVVVSLAIASIDGVTGAEPVAVGLGKASGGEPAYLIAEQRRLIIRLCSIVVSEIVPLHRLELFVATEIAA